MTVGLMANGKIILRVVEPNDLAVMKIGRFHEHDQEDIRAMAVEGLLDAEVIRQRATDALTYYIGNVSMVKYNIRDAVEIIQEASKSLVIKDGAPRQITKQDLVREFSPSSKSRETSKVKPSDTSTPDPMG